MTSQFIFLMCLWLRADPLHSQNETLATTVCTLEVDGITNSNETVNRKRTYHTVDNSHYTIPNCGQFSLYHNYHTETNSIYTILWTFFFLHIAPYHIVHKSIYTIQYCAQFTLSHKVINSHYTTLWQYLTKLNCEKCASKNVRMWRHVSSSSY